jgi:hypothetical protein
VQAGAFVTFDKPISKGKAKDKYKGKGKDKEQSDKRVDGVKKVPSKPCHWCHGPAPFHWSHDCPDKEIYEAALEQVRADVATKMSTSVNTKANSKRTYMTVPLGDESMYPGQF